MGFNQTVDIARIFEAHEEDLRLVEMHLLSTFKTDVALLSLIGRHILKSGGKRMRPLFLIKSARLSGYDGKEHIALSSVVETIHTASLLHDDVVDGAEIRRGNPSAHSLWGNPVVVLAGDYLYSNALRQAVSFKSLPVLDALSTAVSTMAKGELLQMQKSGDLGLTEEDYMHIAAAKTGMLFSAACRTGALLGGCSLKQEEALASYGLNVGVSFQIADDILDYHADENEFGKKLGTDLGEGKITLPLICLLKVVSEEEREEVERMTQEDVLGDDALTCIVELMGKYDVHKEVFGKARKLVDEAKEALMAFPDSTEREEMFYLAEYALQRGK
jgi:octaprenyl-diphosphate synthase